MQTPSRMDLHITTVDASYFDSSLPTSQRMHQKCYEYCKPRLRHEVITLAVRRLSIFLSPGTLLPEPPHLSPESITLTTRINFHEARQKNSSPSRRWPRANFLSAQPSQLVNSSTIQYRNQIKKTESKSTIATWCTKLLITHIGTLYCDLISRTGGPSLWWRWLEASV